MSNSHHSIWLMPRLEDEERFAALVQDLALRFRSPVFQPHLTLVEDMPRSAEELTPLLQSLTDGAASFPAQVERVEESELYYRSFYARFPVVPALKTLKQNAVDLFGVGSLDSFMPHISLAYGVPADEEKHRAVAELHERLHGLNVMFDRVCIVSSSQQTPIEEWKTRVVSSLA
jgi:2'-5' RNA ligase